MEEGILLESRSYIRCQNPGETMLICFACFSFINVWRHSVFFILIASVKVSMRSLTDYLCVNLTEWWLLLRKERLMKSHQILVRFPNPLAFGSQILAL